MNYIIAYDIENDKIRNKVSKILEGYGVRLQKSVFECKLSKTALKKLEKELETLIDRKKDSVIFFKNCQKCVRQRIMLGVPYLQKIVTFIDV